MKESQGNIDDLKDELQECRKTIAALESDLNSLILTNRLYEREKLDLQLENDYLRLRLNSLENKPKIWIRKIVKSFKIRILKAVLFLKRES